MRKEASLYLFLAIVAVGVFLAAYYINFNTTGYAVFDDSGTGFAGTFENTTYSGNASAVILDTNQTTGSYTSEVFDANASSVWDNLTAQQTTPTNTTLSFQVRSCSTADCSGSSFATANLSNMNLTGQYFQYKVSFSGFSTFDNLTNATTYTGPSLSSISIGSHIVSTPIVTSVSVQQPSGTKTSATNLPLNFTTIGTGLTCWYNVKDTSDGAVVLDNTTLSGCANTTFNPGVGEGSYSITVYANGSTGFASASSSFSVDFPNPTTPSEEPAAPEVPVAPTTAAATEPIHVTALTAGEITAQKMIPGSTQDVKWNVQNSGTEPLSACSLKFGGDEGVPAWLSTTDESYNINAGESHEFTIKISPTNTTGDGTYQASISVQCSETSAAKGFGIVVEKKKFDFKIVDTERTGINKVRVVYSLQELTGNKTQNVSLKFLILDLSNAELANATENRTIGVNATKEFTLTIPINGSVNGSFVGNFTLSGAADSEVYHISVLEPITLAEPTGGILGGFAVLGSGLGTGGYILIIVVIVGLAVAFFFVRRMKKTGSRSASRMLSDK